MPQGHVHTPFLAPPLNPPPVTPAICPFRNRPRPFYLRTFPSALPSAWKRPPQSTKTPHLQQVFSGPVPWILLLHFVLHPNNPQFCDSKEPWFVDFEVNICLPNIAELHEGRDLVCFFSSL